MTEVSKATRLSKAAREFNVGIHTIVEFLSKNGIEVEEKPTTKLSPDAYALLVAEFQTEKAVKEESKKKELDTSQHTSISIDDIDRDAAKDDIDKDEEIIIQKTSMIDSESKKTEIAAPAKEKPVAKEEEKKPASAETEKDKKETGDKEQDAEEKPASAETSPDKEEAIKVLDKIDLDSINQKTRPAKKSKEEKEAERAAKKKPAATKKKEAAEEELEVVEEKPEASSEQPAADEKALDAEGTAEDEKTAPAEETEAREETPDENFLETKVDKLSGPKILDKIDLREFEKKPVASSKDDKVSQKKKRKRILTPKHVSDPGSRKGEDRRGKGKGRRRKETPKPELSEEEIQKQIKETLARLAPTGKSKGAKHRRLKRAAVSQQMEEDQKKAEAEKGILKLTEFVTVAELASMMNVNATEVISACMSLGLFVSINQRLDAETLNLVALEFGFEVEFVSVEVQEAISHVEDAEDEAGTLVPRSPIVTVMGHVDHGKTKLLDYIRKANVVAGEAGGITQHIGAYEVSLDDGKKITFLDTPGHEAFTAMRARGAKVTDVAIIIVAADDDVMPQTKEAINHAQAAGVPIVFAINKIDKPNANPDKIKQQLSEMNILIEEWGGKYQSQDISAKEGLNVDELLEKVLLEAEMLELKANPDRRAMGTVIESSLDKGRGFVTNVLVQAGTLHVGDMVLSGSHYGKVKAMYNERNQAVREVGPSSPVLMLGLNGAPQAGDGFNVMKDEREAKSIANKREQLQREQGLRTQKHITLDEIGRRIAIGDFQELNIIVKGDVDGSVEALSDSLLKLSSDEVQVNVILKGVGAVTETDVMLASASNAIIVGFNVRPQPSARKLAEQEQIDIRLYSIIYQAIEEIKSAIEGMLSPDIEEKITCNVEVREVFKITKVGTVAGCMVLDGKITRNTSIRLIRDGIVVYTGVLGSLKRFKDDVKEVNAGYECGLNIVNYNDIKVGDILEGYEEVEVKRTL
ncbi:MAG: translation initiation factor IF-2 [Bacteroidales bacterium]|jgi:translation initiation factor IF-2|nr:translation initiation factor IF-2 [Bacteroidales bacterium]